MRRRAKPRLKRDKVARLEALGWDVEQPHQSVPVDCRGTAEVVTDADTHLALREDDRETVLRAIAPEDLLQVPR